MYMIRLNSIQSIKLDAVICLISLGLSKVIKNYTYLAIKQQKSRVDMDICLDNFSSTLNELFTGYKLLNLTQEQKQKIIDTLYYCSITNDYCYKIDEQYKQKYIYKFRYQYYKQHTNRFKTAKHGTEKKIDTIYTKSIIALYSLYKILQSSSKFSVCRKFKKRKINI